MLVYFFLLCAGRRHLFSKKHIFDKIVKHITNTYYLWTSGSSKYEIMVMTMVMVMFMITISIMIMLMTMIMMVLAAAAAAAAALQEVTRNEIETFGKKQRT